jgi:hypothetical protein
MRAVPKLGPPADTEIWIGGGIIGGNDGTSRVYTDVLFDREHVLQAVDDLTIYEGVPRHNITIKWNNSRDGIRASLDCPSGLLTIQPEIYSPKSL